MTDKEIQQEVLRELEWEPQVNSTEIGVAVKDGVVTLSGFVDGYVKKYNAERAAKRVYGVKAVANDLAVKLPSGAERTDPEIAIAAVQALESRFMVPSDKIKVTVRNGWITLEGTVKWQFQKQAAESAVRQLIGVKGITNMIEVRPPVSAADVKAKIEEALRRSAELDARRITVETEGSKITLRGTVRAWAEREAAERAAWSAPGVTSVDDLITVTP
ncbi:MAG: Transport-associated protein [Chthonomonadaceae bacterium]|nr:Transport-associated protein [Chthonomonadaceae bacterium]